MADTYYKYLVNGREYTEKTSSPISNPADQGYTEISQQEYQQRLPYNNMEEQQFRKLAASGQLPFQTPYPQSQGERQISAQGGGSGNDSEIIAHQIFDKLNPGGDWNSNRASYIAIANSLLSGQQHANPLINQAFQQIQSGQLGVTSGTSGGQPNPVVSANGWISTGDPKVDDFINNVWMPLVQAELSGNPIDASNPALWKQIMDKVEQKYGAYFANELADAKQTMERNEAAIRSNQAENERVLGAQGTDITRINQDTAQGISREEEDKIRLLADSARNYDEHKLATENAFRRAGQTFGGERQLQESKLREQLSREQGLTEQNARRREEDLRNTQERTLADTNAKYKQNVDSYLRQLSQEEQSYATAGNDIEAQKRAAQQQEIKDMIAAGYSMQEIQSHIAPSAPTPGGTQTTINPDRSGTITVGAPPEGTPTAPGNTDPNRVITIGGPMPMATPSLSPSPVPPTPGANMNSISQNLNPREFRMSTQPILLQNSPGFTPQRGIDRILPPKDQFNNPQRQFQIGGITRQL